MASASQMMMLTKYQGMVGKSVVIVRQSLRSSRQCPLTILIQLESMVPSQIELILLGS